MLRFQFLIASSCQIFIVFVKIFETSVFGFDGFPIDAFSISHSSIFFMKSHVLLSDGIDIEKSIDREPHGK